VVIVSTVNEDGSYNLAPISSIFWLGQRAVIGISAFSKTTENIIRTGECVLNMPSANEVEYVDRLALTTGSDPVPPGKQAKGYRTVKDKFAHAGLHPQASFTITAPRVKECPVQLEAILQDRHGLANYDQLAKGRIMILELLVQKVHIEEALIMEGYPNRVDPGKWRPLIMSFQQFYGLGPQLQPSLLASINEELYRA
jgi:flavin reductase (DIM6/NTAB) family NADH-FMN oxidoreductase RutF